MEFTYVSHDEIEAHEAAMQQIVVNAQREAVECIKSATDKAERKFRQSEEKILAMQRDFERLPLLRRVYYEAPDDVFDLIVSMCSQNVHGQGTLNDFRLVNKRLKKVVESRSTTLAMKLAIHQRRDGPSSLLLGVIQACRRIEVISLFSLNLMSLDGCPTGLKKLYINAPRLSDISPLALCSTMEILVIYKCSIVDISAVSSMLLLEKLICWKETRRPSIKDLSPLSSCPRLKCLDLQGNKELKDLSPLSACTALEILDIRSCPLITSLAPLSLLINLKKLGCLDIDRQTSLLPLASCTELQMLDCNEGAVDREELMRQRPQLRKFL